MDIAGYVSILMLAALVIGISFALDRLYARILPVRFLYSAIRMPGIVLHELAHIMGCFLTGAKIKKVVLFSKEGGSVLYVNPKIPVLGNVLISTAPLLFLPLVLSLLTGIFSFFFGCALLITLPESGIGNAPFHLIATVSDLFYTNLVFRFNGWFLLYLYLCVTIVLSLAPSRQDLANAAIGITLIAGCCLLVILIGYTPAISLLGEILDLIAYPFMLGLIFELIAGVVSLPLVIIYGIQGN